MKLNNNLEELITFYREKKMAHAYLITTNNMEKTLNDLNIVIKNIFCEKTFKNECQSCSLCHLIEIGNLPTLCIVKPDGTIIKKDQILELKRLFSTNSQLTKNKVYIIQNAEKMNKESTNTILKFLEEPEDNTYGFFITNNRDNILETIISRCQIIDCYYETQLPSEELGITEDFYLKISEDVNSYLNALENSRANIFINSEILNKYNSKSDITTFFKIIFNTYYQKLKEPSNQNIKILIRKLNIIRECLKELEFNVNLELLLDKFAIEMSDIDENI